MTTAKYSVYPPHFGEPVYKKKDLDKLYENEKIEEYKLIPFKAARSNETCSVFHDPVVAYVLIVYYIISNINKVITLLKQQVH